MRQQLGTGIATVIGGAVLLALAVGLAALSLDGGHLIAIGAFAGGITGIARGSTLIARSRHSLRELPAMPVARALPGSGHSNS